MHQSKSVQYLLVSARDLENIDWINLEYKKQELYIYKVHNIVNIDRLLDTKNNKNIIFYLDNFIIILPDEYQMQNIFWKKFYKIFGYSYEQMIDISNNIKCIEGMVNYINKKVSLTASSKILDFGCGTGLSTLVPFIGSVIGYDPVYEMRIQACKRGLHTLDTEEINSISNNYFDAVFSSYVFHMAVDENDIIKIFPKMKQGAIWIANYYKGINEDFVNNFFMKHGFQVIKIKDIHERFGNIYEYRKGNSTA